MELRLIERGGGYVAEVVSDDIVFHSVQDALDTMAEAQYQGAGTLIIYEKNLLPGFFDLRTGIAGEILQKYSNYRMKLAIVGDFGKVESASLKAFIAESNRGGQIAFVADRETALERS